MKKEEEEIVVEDVISSIDETLASNRKVLNGHRSKILSVLDSYENLIRAEREERRVQRNDYLMRQNITRDISAISSLELAKFLQKGYLSDKTKELMSETLSERDREDRRSDPKQTVVEQTSYKDEVVDENVKRILKESWKKLQDAKSYLGSYLDRANKHNARVETKRKAYI